VTRTPPPRAATSRGFTLLETLVALAVTAVLLGTLAVAVPSTLRAGRGARARLARATTTRSVLLNFERELAGALREPVVLVGTPVARLEFTGGAEPGERLAYTTERGRLVRRATPRFAAAPAPGRAVTVLDDVAAVELRAFDGRDWVAEWHERLPPEAVRIRIVFADGDAAGTVATIPTAPHRRPS
jgi:prepilin-type N-terminal cleavage/methylation domain-containing protein